MIQLLNESKNYKDITKSWLKEKNNELGKCTNKYYFIDQKYKAIHIVDGKNVILDHSKSEEEIARFYAKTKNINVKMLPRIINPKGIKVADFIEETSGITWEIKEPISNTIGTTIHNQFKNQKEKAHNFIIDMHLSNMKIKTAIEEIGKEYERYDWIEEVILLKNLKVKKVFKKQIKKPVVQTKKGSDTGL